MNRVRVGNWYMYTPVGLDRWSPCTNLKEGDYVKVVNLNNAPPANTMGHCYVEDVNSQFRGLVLCNSLEKTAEK